MATREEEIKKYIDLVDSAANDMADASRDLVRAERRTEATSRRFNEYLDKLAKLAMGDADTEVKP